MRWTEVFAVFVLCHLAGDFLLQTEWQAQNKHLGLGPDRVRRRALFSHVATYGLAFVPALIWLATDVDGWVVVAAVAILVPHLVQDDGRLLLSYLRGVKRTNAGPTDFVYIAVDQTFHLLALFALALAISG